MKPINITFALDPDYDLSSTDDEEISKLIINRFTRAIANIVVMNEIESLSKEFNSKEYEISD